LNSFRQASTLTTPLTKLKNLFYGTALVLGSSLLYFYLTDTRASLHRWLVVPVLRRLYGDAEEAHHAGNAALKFLWQFGLYPRERGDPDRAGDLQIDVFGYTLVNPIATSAGIDKDADIPDALFAIGPSIVEIGGATPLPQDGNPKPRVFRVPSQNALINRYGLNSEGADHMAVRLRHRVREFAYAQNLGKDTEAEQYVLNGRANVPPGSLAPGRLLAVNIAKNKQTPDDDLDRVKEDYVYCVERLGPYADILVVNVSSPNTPGLRSLQKSKPLTEILTAVVGAARNVKRTKTPAVMVKVSPDEDSDAQIAGICEAIWQSGVDGVIVGNTTKRRPDPLPLGYKLSPAEEQVLLEQGGYSGPQLFGRTVSLVKRYRKLLDNRPPPAPQQKALKHEEPKNEAPHHEAEGATESGKLMLQKPGPVAIPHDIDGVQASVSSGKIDAKNPSERPDSDKQPLFQVPTEKYYHLSRPEEPQPLEVPDTLRTNESEASLVAESSRTGKTKPSMVSDVSSEREPMPPVISKVLPKRDDAKVIFATGGITNGKQALDALKAGADLVSIYTALVYGGVGTISRIKDEMRSEIKKANETRKR
jgi:dihydroorotate dehydrogenase